MAKEVPHKGGRTLGFRVSDGHSSVAYVPDHCPTALGDGPQGIGAYHDAILELASGVDLLIHDSHLRAEEVAEEGSFGHAAAEYAVGLGNLAGARGVVLFHHRPERTDAGGGSHRVPLRREPRAGHRCRGGNDPGTVRDR